MSTKQCLLRWGKINSSFIYFTRDKTPHCGILASPVKKTEYPEDDSRAEPLASAQIQLRTAETKPPASEPASSADALSGTRNLAWAVISFLVAAIALWLGMKINRAAVAQSLFASLGAFGVLWLLYNFRLLRQRNGILLAVALVVLLGTAIPFVVAGLSKLDHLADERLATKEAGAADMPAPTLTIPTEKTAPPAPPTPDLPKEKPAPEKLAKEKPALPAEDGIVREFMAPPPDPKAGKLIRIKQDCIVTIDGRKWSLKAGQVYQFKGLEDGIVTFRAGDQEVSIEADYVTFTGQSKETPEKITQMAAAEAARRYPALGNKDSKENVLLVSRKKELEQEPSMKEIFFKDPKWPLVLAEQLAEQEGWKRADLPEETTPPTEAAPKAADEKL